MSSPDSEEYGGGGAEGSAVVSLVSCIHQKLPHVVAVRACMQARERERRWYGYGTTPSARRWRCIQYCGLQPKARGSATGSPTCSSTVLLRHRALGPSSTESTPLLDSSSAREVIDLCADRLAAAIDG